MGYLLANIMLQDKTWKCVDLVLTTDLISGVSKKQEHWWTRQCACFWVFGVIPLTLIRINSIITCQTEPRAVISIILLNSSPFTSLYLFASSESNFMFVPDDTEWNSLQECLRYYIDKKRRVTSTWTFELWSPKSNPFLLEYGWILMAKTGNLKV